MNLLLFKKRNHRNADFIFYVLVKLTQKKEEILNTQLLNANHLRFFLMVLNYCYYQNFIIFIKKK